MTGNFLRVGPLQVSDKDTQLCNSFQCTLDMGRVCVCVFFSQLCLIFLQPYGLQPARLLCPWNSPGENTGVCCVFLLQVLGIRFGSPPLQADSSPRVSPGKPEVKIEVVIIYVGMRLLYCLFKRHSFPYELLCAFIINKFKVSVQAYFCYNDLFVSTLVPHTLNHCGFRVSLIFK